MKKTKLTTAALLVGLSVLLTACAKPKQGADFEHVSKAIRAAELAGAATYAPTELSIASRNFSKAQVLVNNNRQDRAQKLLQIAIAQAELAKAVSEADHAETSLQRLQAAN